MQKRGFASLVFIIADRVPRSPLSDTPSLRCVLLRLRSGGEPPGACGGGEPPRADYSLKERGGKLKQNSLQRLGDNKIKRGKIAFCQALPVKLVVQVFRMSEASRTNEAERVEFSRLSIIRLKAYSARKEGKTEPQASRACEWRGFPLKRRRKVPCEVIIHFDYNFIARHFQPAPKRSAHSITRLICGAPPC